MHVTIRDDGPGIAPEHVDRIFEPFKRLTTDAERSGLGLAICRKIVAMHGGRIWYEPSPGGGATFKFTLPKAGAPPDAPAQQLSLVGNTPAPRVKTDDSLATVLLVDDLEDHLELTRLMLFEAGGYNCNLLTASDGQQALDVIRERADNGDKVDLVLLDINMPRMDGFEFMARKRSDDHLKDAPPVVMCTASGHERDKQRAKELGAAGYMVKPPSWAHLEPIIDALVGVRIEPGPKINRVVREQPSAGPRNNG